MPRSPAVGSLRWTCQLWWKQRCQLRDVVLHQQNAAQYYSIHEIIVSLEILRLYKWNRSLCIGYNICLHQCKSKVFVSTKHCSVLTLLILSILAAAQHFNLVYLQPCLLSLPQCHCLQNAQHGFIDILQKKQKTNASLHQSKIEVFEWAKTIHQTQVIVITLPGTFSIRYFWAVTPHSWVHFETDACYGRWLCG